MDFRRHTQSRSRSISVRVRLHQKRRVEWHSVTDLRSQFRSFCRRSQAQTEHGGGE